MNLKQTHKNAQIDDKKRIKVFEMNYDKHFNIRGGT